MIACRTPACTLVGQPAGWLELGAYRRPVGGPCPECKGPTEGPDNSTLVVPPPHQVSDGPDHRATAYSATAALLELTCHLDPALRPVLEIGYVGIKVHLLNSDVSDGSALAGRLAISEYITHDTLTDRHHRWTGSWRGFPTTVVVLENLPAVVTA